MAKTINQNEINNQLFAGLNNIMAVLSTLTAGNTNNAVAAPAPETTTTKKNGKKSEKSTEKSASNEETYPSSQGREHSKRHFFAKVDSTIRCRIPEFAYNADGTCKINGKTSNAQAEGRGREYFKDLGAKQGDIVEFVQITNKPHQYTARINDSSNNLSNDAGTQKETKKQESGKDGKKSLKLGKQVEAEAIVKETFAERMARGKANAAKQREMASNASKTANDEKRGANIDAFINDFSGISLDNASIEQLEMMLTARKSSPVQVPQNAEKSNGKSKKSLQIGSQTKKSDNSGERELPQAIVDMFKTIVKRNKKNPNWQVRESYSANDGRRYLKRSERRDFNSQARKAGFITLEDLAEAGKLIHVK